jgi:hypothetical protein
VLNAASSFPLRSPDAVAHFRQLVVQVLFRNRLFERRVDGTLELLDWKLTIAENLVCFAYLQVFRDVLLAAWVFVRMVGQR